MVKRSSFKYRGHPTGYVAITSLAASVDGEKVAVGYEDGLVHLWQIKRRQQDLLGLCDSRTAVVCIVFSPDGKLLATLCDGSHQVQIWSIQGEAYTLPNAVGRLSGYQGILLSPVCDMLACFRPDKSEGNIEIWEVVEDFESTIETPEGVTRVAFSHDGNRLAAALTNGSIQLYQFDYIKIRRDHKPEKTNQFGDARKVQLLLFSPDATQLAASCNFNEMRIWTLDQEVLSGLIPHYVRLHTKEVDLIIYSPSSALLASASLGGTLHVWEAKTGSSLFTFEAPSFSTGAFAPNDTLFASYSGTDSIHIQDLKSARSILLRDDDTSDYAAMPPLPLRFSQDSLYLATAVAEPPHLRLWDIKSATVIERIQIDHVERHLEIHDVRIGEYIKTNRGYFPLKRSKNLCEKTPGPQALWRIQDEWVWEGEKEMLWLPSGHRPKEVQHMKTTFLLRTETDAVERIEFCKEPVPYEIEDGLLKG